MFGMCVDLLRIEKTSGGFVRERMECEINKVLIGSVSMVVMFKYLIVILQLQCFPGIVRVSCIAAACRSD